MGKWADPQEEIEVLLSRAAAWCWRCHLCDITVVGLAEEDARHEARMHRMSDDHKREMLKS